MSPALEEQVLALICDREGNVQRVVRNDLILLDRELTGLHVSDLVDQGSKEKTSRFFAELEAHKVAYDWEMSVTINEKLVPLHFFGASIDAEHLVVMTLFLADDSRLNDELMLINNEQTNSLRSAAKDLSCIVGKRTSRSDFAYEEMSRLNNEMANLQREMAKKNAELNLLHQQMNRLLGMAAHDLRTPLGVILTYATFLESEAASVLNQEQQEFVTTIKDMSEFMLRMVTDILDVTAIESGQLKLDRQPADLARLTQHVVTLNRLLAAKKDILIDFETPAVLPPLVFDSGKIVQVLNNLISNALKFSHRGTRIKVQLSCTDKVATLTVQDQGQGIPAADFPKLFKAFSTTSVRSTAEEHSTGLGLAIVRRIIEEHGGRIWVESEVGQGSTFSFTIPISDPLKV
jgi:two-component system OmpR family sensor kinase